MKVSLGIVMTTGLLLAASGCGKGPDPIPPVAAPARSAPSAQPASLTTAAPDSRPELPKLTGDELARAVRANLSFPYERIGYKMELVDSRGAVETRQAVFHLSGDLEGQDASYVVFTAPPEIDGFGLLTMRPATGDPSQFLYVPAAKKVTRILYFSTNRRSSFCGTQLTFEDLEPMRVEDYAFTIAGTGVQGGLPSYLLESKPKNRYSGYSKISSWVSAQTHLVMRAEYHDPKGELLKVATSEEPFQIGPKHWRFKLSSIKNEQNSQATHLQVISYSSHAGKLTAEEKGVFTLKTLSLGREK